MAAPASDDPSPYGSAEVCLAAKVPRGTFDAWLLRRYLPLAAGHPGKGTERRFSLLDATRVAVIAELVGLGVPVSAAAGYSAVVQDYIEHTVMILVRREKGTMPKMSIVPFAQLKNLSKWLSPGATIIDLSVIAANTKRTLADPATKHRARMRITSGFAAEATEEKITLEVFDPSAQDEGAPEPAPGRERAKVKA